MHGPTLRPVGHQKSLVYQEFDSNWLPCHPALRRVARPLNSPLFFQVSKRQPLLACFDKYLGLCISQCVSKCLVFHLFYCLRHRFYQCPALHNHPVFHKVSRLQTQQPCKPARIILRRSHFRPVSREMSRSPRLLHGSQCVGQCFGLHIAHCVANYFVLNFC